MRALQADLTLPFSYERLGDFLRLEDSSWQYYRRWYEILDQKVHVNMITKDRTSSEVTHS